MFLDMDNYVSEEKTRKQARFETNNIVSLGYKMIALL